MSKTIEEAAREYVNDVYSGDTDFIDEVENVLTWLFNKPLRDRLTEAEKERVRYIRHEILCSCDSIPTGWDFPFQCAIRDIEEIFGAEMFNENKSE